MEYKKELQKLNEIKKLINKTVDHHKKLLLIRDYFNLVAYLDKLSIIDGKKYIFDLKDNFDFYIKKCDKEKIKQCKNFNNSIESIIAITDSLINIYNTYSFKREKIVFDDSIDIKEGMDELYSFFSALGCEFYNLFITLNEESRISLKPNLDSDGYAYKCNYSDGSYIILNDNGYNYGLLSSLAHEVGHCYEFMLNKNDKHVYSSHNLAEVPSLFMQRLFDWYMKKNSQYHQMALFCECVWQNVLYERTLSNDYTNKMILSNYLDSLDYQYGLFLFDNNHINDYINNNNINSIIEFRPSLDNYLYVLNDVIAINLVEIYSCSKKDALNILKEIIINNGKYQKVLNEYGLNMEGYKKKINEVKEGIKVFKK